MNEDLLTQLLNIPIRLSSLDGEVIDVHGVELADGAAGVKILVVDR